MRYCVEKMFSTVSDIKYIYLFIYLLLACAEVMVYNFGTGRSVIGHSGQTHDFMDGEGEARRSGLP